MATAINTAALTGSKLDVASIVKQLMQVERQPITALQERLDTTGVRITALGSLQSKFSALRDAVQDLQTPSLFKRQSASSSAPGVLTAAASETAVPGRYDVQVLALASASQFALVQGLNQSTSYRITTPVNGTSRSFDFVATSLTDLQAQVEAESALQGVLTVSLLDDRRGFLQGLQTGASNAISLSINGVAESAYATNPMTQQSSLKPGYAVAADAQITLGGLDVSRESNRFEVLGLDLELTQLGSSTVWVRREQVDPAEAIDRFVFAYNQLLAEYRQQTASNVEADQRGVLNSDNTLNGLMQQVNQYLRSGFTDASGSNRGLADLGLELSRSGELVAMTDSGLSKSTVAERLASGLFVGSGSSQNLMRFIDDALSYGGVLTERVEAEKTAQRDLLERQGRLEEKMQEIERRYTSQYAALDALLFRLNTTSTALKSAIDALTASMKND